jgi:RHS repeat-associated protein
MGFRDYSPGLNRFLTRDAYSGALADLNLSTDPWNANRYAFAGGNPISRVEVDGHYNIDDEGNRVPSQPQEPLRPPTVSNTKLQNLLNSTYLREQAVKGKGTGKAAAALKYELESGQRLNKRVHQQKVISLAKGYADLLFAHDQAKFNKGAGLLTDREVTIANDEFKELWNVLKMPDEGGLITRELGTGEKLERFKSDLRSISENQAVATHTGSQFEEIHPQRFTQKLRTPGPLSMFGRTLGVAGFVLDVPMYVEAYRAFNGQPNNLDEMLFPGAGTCMFNCQVPVS